MAENCSEIKYGMGKKKYASNTTAAIILEIRVTRLIRLTRVTEENFLKMEDINTIVEKFPQEE